MIETTNLTKYYNKNARGIIDVSLEITKGEIFGFIGPNGAGKSTTVRTILNLIFPTEGSATVDGLDVVKDTVKVRSKIGYIPSETSLYGDMRVKDFLKYSASLRKKDCTQRIKSLSERLELDLERKIEDLSFGNRKKVMIVSALMHEPDILILDEPTSGLNPLMQNTFFKMVEEERQRGATIFFSSHILSEVQRICDRVGIIREGRLVKVESVKDIMRTRAKKVRIRTEEAFLEESETIKNLEHVDGEWSFVYTGDISDLLALLASHQVDDLSVTDPSLEEIFMHYYEKEDGQ
jgi:ABC-2 type transport system ATP-binding protein